MTIIKYLLGALIFLCVISWMITEHPWLTLLATIALITGLAIRNILTSSKKQPPIIYGDGNYNLEVVGEYYHIDPSKQLQGTGIVFSVFTLRPEKVNEHDKNAVMVLLGNQPVGYLSRKDAIKYREKYGGQAVRFMGLIQSGDVVNSVWLDAKFGSGLQKSNPLMISNITKAFPVKVNCSEFLENVVAASNDFEDLSPVSRKVKVPGPHDMDMRRPKSGYQMRVFAAKLNKGPDGISVLSGNYQLGVITARNAKKLGGQSLPGETMGILFIGCDGWEVRIGDKVAPISQEV